MTENKIPLDMSSKEVRISFQPCPICKSKMWIIGITKKNKKLTSCGCAFKFTRTKSQKDMDRKYIRTEFGLELIKK